MPIPTNGGPGALTRGLLRDDVYARLREAIVDGTFQPGEQLRDQELAEWLGVSRTPVREAMLRLAGSGLVSAAPGRSTTVAPLEVRAVRDAAAVVAAMHRLAVEQSVDVLTEDDLREMRRLNREFDRALKRGDVDAALAADDDFHAIPVGASGNEAIAAVLDQFTPVVRRLERLRFGSLPGRTSVALHGRLVDLCAARQKDAAADVSHETWQTLEPLLTHLEGTDPS